MSLSGKYVCKKKMKQSAKTNSDQSLQLIVWGLFFSLVSVLILWLSSHPHFH
jgi:hypothetical protein